MKHWSEETNWKSLGSAVASLKSKVERAYYEGREQAADDAHDDLTAAEWRMRQAEKRAGK